MGDKLERILEVEPAFDKRHTNPAKNYGTRGATMKMLVKGSKGVIQFVIYTNWQLPHVMDEQDRKISRGGVSPCIYRPMAADLEYHSPEPRYEGQTLIQDDCPYLDGRPCYYDGTSLGAEKVLKLLISEGSESVWPFLENEYKERFDR